MVEFPAGTVTFVFTDIERSTRLLDELGGERYAEALADHRRAVRAAFGSGHEVDTQGDAFFYAFERASDAVTACSEAVAGLEGSPVRIRIGVHTGEPLLTDEGYVGMDVHRAARIAGAAHGGQVVVSRTTRDLVPELEFLDLGEHRLKDLARAERLFQLGRAEFPPLRSLHRTNLPVPASPLVGRERELTELVSLIRGGRRIVTLTGPGGSGKTRLAVQAAAELADVFDGGTFFSSLASVASSDRLPTAVASAVGLRSDENVLSAIVSKRLLLVLDNAEHLDGVDRFAGALVAESPGPVLLVTSRAPLHLAAETEYLVEPLATEAAAKLFVARAAALGRRLARDDAVNAVCARVDNLPLAVELAAARTRTLTPAALLERLDVSLPLLVGGPHDAPVRQQTLRATIDWSYRLLDEDEKVLFRRLAIFRGNFTLEAATAVAGADLLSLESLVEQNLVKAVDHDRFLVLETLREFAASETLPDEEHALARVHADYYAELAEREAPTPPALAAEIPNLRAALDALAAIDVERFLAVVNAIWRVWTELGLLRDGQRYAALAMQLGADAPDEVRVQLLRNASWAASWLGALDDAIPLAQQRLELARRLEDPPGTLAALSSLCQMLVIQRDLVGARALGAEALELARQLGDPQQLAVALGALVTIDQATKDYAACVRHTREGVEVAREMGDRTQELHWIQNYGQALLMNGELDQAEANLREALAGFDSPITLSWAVSSLGQIAAQRGDVLLGARLVSAGEAQRTRMGYVPRPDQTIEYERGTAVLRAQRSDPAVDAAWREGAEMTLEDARTAALAHPTRGPLNS